MDASSWDAGGSVNKARLAGGRTAGKKIRKDNNCSIIKLHEIRPVETSRKRSTIDEFITFDELNALA